LDGEPTPTDRMTNFYEKGDKPLEIVTSRQWYLRNGGTDEALNAQLIERGKELQFHPDFMRVRYENWVHGLNGDWLISRQRFFGVPFPLWYSVDANGEADYAHPLIPAEDQLPIDPTSDVPVGYTESQRDQPNGFTAEQDIMDTWATSSLTPQIVTHWAEPDEASQALFKATFPMDLRPQGQDIIRTWLFSSVDRAHLENKCLPWAHTALSGWILDPDHKKMSKSKGNVVVPNEPIEKFGADAVRYWAASARLGLDATYDEGQMKIGRRLAIKLLNATKFALAIGREDEHHHVGEGGSQVWKPSDVTEALDRSVMASLAQVVREAGQALDSYEHSKALEAIETFFWQFCDDYIELAKNRAYGTADATGKVPTETAVLSARTTLGLGLDAFARLFAPYLPYATEEVWSWMHDGAGSVHRAAWPDAGLYEQAAAGAGTADADTPAADAGILLWAGKALAELRGLKSQAKVSMKTPILSATLLVPAAGVQAVQAVIDDIAEAGRVTGPLDVQAAEASGENESNEPTVAVAASELGEPPAKKPKR
jgi:valyl-tRNA synthetase